MELVTPGIGLLFWMLLSFTIVLIILRRFAWKPILQALQDREEHIELALTNAEKAREEIAVLQNEKQSILNNAKTEKEDLLKRAKEDISDYKKLQKNRVDEQMKATLGSALDEIAQQKRAAMDELKETVASLSVEIAEKILIKELDDKDSHNAIIQESIKKLEIK